MNIEKIKNNAYKVSKLCIALYALVYIITMMLTYFFKFETGKYFSFYFTFITLDILVGMILLLVSSKKGYLPYIYIFMLIVTFISLRP